MPEWEDTAVCVVPECLQIAWEKEGFIRATKTSRWRATAPNQEKILGEVLTKRYQVVLVCNTAHSAAYRTTNHVSDTAYLETHSVAHHRLLLFWSNPIHFFTLDSLFKTSCKTESFKKIFSHTNEWKMRSLPRTVTCGNTRIEMKAWYGEDASQTVWMGFYLRDPLVTQQHGFASRTLCPAVALNKGDFWIPISWDVEMEEKRTSANNSHPCWSCPTPLTQVWHHRLASSFSRSEFCVCMHVKACKTQQGRGCPTSACCSTHWCIYI